MKIASTAARAYKATTNIYQPKQQVMVEYERLNSPPIPLVPKPSKLNSENTVTIQIPMNPNTPEGDWNSTNTIKKSYYLLSADCTPEDFCKTMAHVDGICTATNHENDFEHFIKLLQLMMDTDNTEKFQEVLADLNAYNAELDDPVEEAELKKMVLNQFSREFFGDYQNCYRKQHRYLKKCVIPKGWTVKQFITRLQTVGKYMAYFAYDEEHFPDGHDAMKEVDLMDIIDYAAKPTWHAQMKRDNKTVDSFASVGKLKEYFIRLEESEQMDGTNQPDTPEQKSVPRKRKDRSDSKENVPNKRNGGKKCTHCGKPGHLDSKCWELEANKESRPKFWKSVKKSGETTRVATAPENPSSKRARVFKDITNNKTVNPSEQVNSMKDNRPKRKMEATTEHESVDFESMCPMKAMLTKNDSSSDNESSTSDFDGYSTEYLNPFFNREELHKKAKVGHYTAEIVVEILDRNNKLVPMRALLDTGTTSTIVLRDYVKKGRASGYSGHKTLWKTMGGNFSTKKKALLDFKFPELNTDKKITWVCHVDEKTEKEHALYDMIIGMDLMTAIGVYVDTENKVIHWEGNITPLGMRGLDQETVNAIYAITQDTSVVQQAEERQQKILDADYSQVDIDEYVNSLSDLTTVEKEQLKFLLHKHPKLFQGGLGILDVPPVHLEVKEGSKPCHARPCPIPQSVKSTTKKEMDRLESIGVLKKSSDSDWAAPMFVQRKKTGDVRVLVDFRRLNDCILRKPFPLPKIQDLLQTLTGFKYATAIDLSMGYYHIPLDAASQKLCSMVLPWAKYQWARLPMGVKCAPDIFQSIISNLFSDLEWVRAYIDDALITSNGDYKDHLQKVDLVLARLEKAGFRANVRKCFFARTEIEYLGYWLSRNGIQPQPKKVEATLRLQPPRNTRQLRHFLGMVNFCRDSHVEKKESSDCSPY